MVAIAEDVLALCACLLAMTFFAFYIALGSHRR